MVQEFINERMREIRSSLVLLDIHLAEMYGVDAKDIREAVKANLDRFPIDFFFQLNEMEVNELVGEKVIPSKESLGGELPFVFLKPGIVMLAMVLKSQKAIDLSITIVRNFILLRYNVMNYSEIKSNLGLLQNEMNTKFKDLYEAMTFHQATMEDMRRSPIGFRGDKKDGEDKEK